MLKIREKLESLLSSSSADNRRPLLGKGNESNVKGLYIIGDLAGAPVIKLAMAQGFEVIETIRALPDMKTHVGAAHADDDGVIDVLIVGAGASGLNATLACKEQDMSHLVLKKGKIANTIESFPEGKWVYAEPNDIPPKGKLWLDRARKEDLVERWNRIVEQNGLDIRIEEALTSLDRLRGTSAFPLSGTRRKPDAARPKRGTAT